MRELSSIDGRPGPEPEVYHPDLPGRPQHLERVGLDEMESVVLRPTGTKRCVATKRGEDRGH